MIANSSSPLIFGVESSLLSQSVFVLSELRKENDGSTLQKTELLFSKQLQAGAAVQTAEIIQYFFGTITFNRLS